jgi:hypothetical protein
MIRDSYPISESEVGTIGSSLPESHVVDDMVHQYAINEPLISLVADEPTGTAEVEGRPQEMADPEVVNPRGYQKEMLEQSLKRNVIIAVSYELRIVHSNRIC